MSRLLTLLFALPLLLVLVACGGSESEEEQGIEVGATAPDFTLPDAVGGEVSLSDYEGQPVLLYFHMAIG